MFYVDTKPAAWHKNNGHLTDLNSIPEFEIKHNLSRHFPALLTYKSRRKMLKSTHYRQIEDDVEKTLASMDWGRAKHLISSQNKGFYRTAFWNIERGKAFSALKHVFLNDSILSRSDLILLNEVDIGMGRSGNRNVAKDLAEILGMYYCFAPSFFVLCKGDVGEQAHEEENTLSLYGDAILSRYPIQGAQNVPLPSVRNYFETKEPRLGFQRGLIARFHLPDGPLDVATTHLEIFASAKQRALQLEALLRHFSAIGGQRQLLGGDFNTCTYNLRNKLHLTKSLAYKFVRVGFRGTIEHYMTPEILFERPVFKVLQNFGFEVDPFNDRTKGTCYYDIYDPIVVEKSKDHAPEFMLRWLRKKLEPWGGIVANRIDWFAGRGIRPPTPNHEVALPPQVIEKPQWNGIRASDHNPIVLDLPFMS